MPEPMQDAQEAQKEMIMARRCRIKTGKKKGQFTRCRGKRGLGKSSKRKGRCLKWSKGRTRCLKRKKS